MKRKILLFFVFIIAVSTGFAQQVNVTFELNAETIAAIDPSGIYIAGGSSFGNPGDNQLSDPDGDGIYTITIQQDLGFSSNYVFLNGNCPDYSCKENLFGLPCGDPNNFNDRSIGPVTQDTTVLACFGTCDSDGGCTIVTDSIDITFEVNTATLPAIDPAGLFVAGGSGFGNPGDNPLVDPDGDGIYVSTVRRPVGFTSHYTFLNGNCPDYSCKENLGGLPCGDPNNFNDRLLPIVTSDTTILACFGTCDSNGSCTLVTDSIDITFNLNTANITPDPGGIFIAGGGNFGNPGDNPMIDPDGDGIYTFTIRRAVGFSSFYTFTNGNCPDFSCKEDLEGLSCGDPDNFNDRFLPAVTSDSTILVCFGNCASDGSCMTTSISNLSIDENLFTIQPTLAHDHTNIIFGDHTIVQEKQMVLMNTNGEALLSTTVQSGATYRLNTTHYPSGIYILSIATEEKLLTKKFIIQR
ncbi:MAG: T9SS type A sorting domain-containing protein [Bacteroidota bacterium]